MKPLPRLALSTGSLSSWLALLLVGQPLGPWVHLLGLAALVLFPWRAIAATRREEEDE